MKSLYLLSGFILAIAMSTTSMAEEASSASGELNEKCTYPQQPTIPTGSSATETELIEAQGKMKAYLADGEEFITCLHRVEDSWGKDEKTEKASFIVMFHNRIVDDMNEVADLFNAAVRAFKGKK